MARQESDEELARAFATVQATLMADHMFFEAVRGELRKKAPLSDFPTISSPNGPDYLLEFTRFLFFLKALDCSDSASIGRFIDLHNEKLEGDLASPNFSRSAAETKKAIFRKARKERVVGTIKTFGRPVFAIYEIAHFLIDTMSPKTTEKLIEDLRYGGLIVRREDPRIDSDQKRVLVESNGVLEREYVAAMAWLRGEIVNSP